MTPWGKYVNVALNLSDITLEEERWQDCKLCSIPWQPTHASANMQITFHLVPQMPVFNWSLNSILLEDVLLQKTDMSWSHLKRNMMHLFWTSASPMFISDLRKRQKFSKDITIIFELRLSGEKGKLSLSQEKRTHYWAKFRHHCVSLHVSWIFGSVSS